MAGIFNRYRDVNRPAIGICAPNAVKLPAIFSGIILARIYRA
jgi:hypothetical protein